MHPDTKREVEVAIHQAVRGTHQLEVEPLRKRVEDLTFALKEIRAAIKETADADSDELLMMLDGIARDALAGSVLTSPQESGSSGSAR
jgi:hypothetical protein